MDVVNKLESCTVDDLLQTFNDQGLSDYLVVFLRYVNIWCKFYWYMKCDGTLKIKFVCTSWCVK